MRAEDLEQALDGLVSAERLSAEQAEAVRRAAADVAARRTRAPLAVIVGYVGGLMAAAGALTLVTMFWAQLQPWAQTALLALGALLLAGAGGWALGAGVPAARRLTGLLWALSSGLAGATAWFGIDALLGEPDAFAPLLLGATVTATGWWFWRRHRSALQLLTLCLGVLVTILSALGTLERPPVEWFGLVIWAVGGAVALLAWGGQAQPVRAGFAIGAVGIAVGAQMLRFGDDAAGLALGLGSVALLFVAGARLAEPVMVGVASAAFAVFLPQAVDHWFPGRIGAPAALLLAGAALLAGALATVRSARGEPPSQPPGDQAAISAAGEEGSDAA